MVGVERAGQRGEEGRTHSVPWRPGSAMPRMKRVMRAIMKRVWMAQKERMRRSCRGDGEGGALGGGFDDGIGGWMCVCGAFRSWAVAVSWI